MDPRREMVRTYYKVFKRKPNIERPHDLIEKIFWLQLHTDTSLWTRCADKFAMRGYVKDCGLDVYLPRNLGRWERSEDVDLSSLPDEFVLKTNNGCGTCLFVRDKKKTNERIVKTKLRRWMNTSYGWSGAQLHYTRIKPCIIAEELLHQDNEQMKYSPHSMVDYKVWCINGLSENVLVVYDRNETGYCLDLYDTHWNRMKDKLNFNGHFCFREESIPKPKCLNKMLEIAESLAKPFKEVRVDFYIINNEPVIGELTFTTGYGYFTEDYYSYLGEKIQLGN